jgi:hypothetical protein
MAERASTGEGRTDPYPRREKFLVFASFCLERMQNLPRRRGGRQSSHGLTDLQEVIQVWPAR